MSRRTGMNERVIDLAFAETMAPERIAAQHALLAQQILRDHLRGLAYEPDVITFVDGRRGLPESAVRPFGVIRYEFTRLGEAVAELLDWLIAHSPEATGAYKESFFVGVNGRKIAAAQFSPRSVPPDAEVIVGNDRSYNRKVDVQMIGLRVMQFNVPPFLFERGARWMRKRFPDLSVKRQYAIHFPGQYILKTGRRAGKPVHSPGLVIRRR